MHLSKCSFSLEWLITPLCGFAWAPLPIQPSKRVWSLPPLGTSVHHAFPTSARVVTSRCTHSIHLPAFWPLIFAPSHSSHLLRLIPVCPASGFSAPKQRYLAKEQWAGLMASLSGLSVTPLSWPCKLNQTKMDLVCVSRNGLASRPALFPVLHMELLEQALDPAQDNQVWETNEGQYWLMCALHANHCLVSILTFAASPGLIFLFPSQLGHSGNLPIMGRYVSHAKTHRLLLMLLVWGPRLKSGLMRQRPTGQSPHAEWQQIIPEDFNWPAPPPNPPAAQDRNSQIFPLFMSQFWSVLCNFTLDCSDHRQ